ncbi:hypothetical protein LZ31DRAFT_556681 [Colletotrichum somersetense]|nr:hypothetical protein LZ31DRAFT_556681 [Colletotrichum somersetense]
MRHAIILSILSVTAMAMPIATPTANVDHLSHRAVISQEELEVLASKTGKTVDEISQALYSSWGTYKFTEEDLAALAASKVKRAQISQEELEDLASKTGKTVDEISQALYSSWGTYKFTEEDLAALAASKK